MIVTASSCQHFHTTTPLKSELAIAPLNVYESVQDRALAYKYQGSLTSIYSNIRSQFKPNHLEFFLISGLCFRRLQINKGFDIYLSINTKTDEIFRNNNTTFEQRAAAVFNHYTKDLFAIAAQEKEILQDDEIRGIMVNTRWQLENTVSSQYNALSFEQMTLVVQKEEIADYLNRILTDQDLLNRSTLIAIKADNIPRIIQLHLE